MVQPNSFLCSFSKTPMLHSSAQQKVVESSVKELTLHVCGLTGVLMVPGAAEDHKELGRSSFSGAMLGDPLSPAAAASTAHPALDGEIKPAVAEPAELDDLSADEVASPPPAEHTGAAPVLGAAGAPTDTQSGGAAQQALPPHTAAQDAGDVPGAPTNTAPRAAADPVPAAASNGVASEAEPGGDQAGATARTPSVTESMAAALASKLRQVMFQTAECPYLRYMRWWLLRRPATHTKQAQPKMQLCARAA